jgi:ABC-type transporter Mla maintaining outer membrane lipid asymmetry ATPase subunit MlaF
VRLESLRLEGVDFAYKNHPVFENLNFLFPLGQNFLVTGPAASGRSCLLKLLAAIVLPQKGSYWLNGVDVNTLSFEEFAPYRKMIGYSFDFGGLLANRTLAENLILPLLYHGDISVRDARARVESFLEIFHLSGHGDQRPAAVSGSVRKATVVARAMIAEPSLLLLDDPFVGINETQCEAIFSTIAEQKRNGKLQQVLFTSSEHRFSEQLEASRLEIENRTLRIDSPRNQKISSGKDAA